MFLEFAFMLLSLDPHSILMKEAEQGWLSQFESKGHWGSKNFIDFPMLHNKLVSDLGPRAQQWHTLPLYPKGQG